MRASVQIHSIRKANTVKDSTFTNEIASDEVKDTEMLRCLDAEVIPALENGLE